jgi:surface antigen
MSSLRLAALVMAALAAAHAGSSGAAGWGQLLKNTPFEFFDSDDLQMFIGASKSAVAQAPDGKPVNWSNPDTGHGGDVTLLRNFQNGGRPCAALRVRTQAEGRRGDTTINVCQVDGKWKLLSAGELRGG